MSVNIVRVVIIITAVPESEVLLLLTVKRRKVVSCRGSMCAKEAIDIIIKNIIMRYHRLLDIFSSLCEIHITIIPIVTIM